MFKEEKKIKNLTNNFLEVIFIKIKLIMAILSFIQGKIFIQ